MARACVEIANALRRIVETLTDESVAARLKNLADGYEHRPNTYSTRTKADRGTTADEYSRVEQYLTHRPGM